MLGKIIKYMRNQKKIKQIELIKILNIGQSTLSDYENNKISIDFEMLEKIATICDYEIFFKNKNNGEIITTKNIERKID